MQFIQNMDSATEFDLPLSDFPVVPPPTAAAGHHFNDDHNNDHIERIRELETAYHHHNRRTSDLTTNNHNHHHHHSIPTPSLLDSNSVLAATMLSATLPAQALSSLLDSYVRNDQHPSTQNVNAPDFELATFPSVHSTNTVHHLMAHQQHDHQIQQQQPLSGGNNKHIHHTPFGGDGDDHNDATSGRSQGISHQVSQDDNNNDYDNNHRHSFGRDHQPMEAIYGAGTTTNAPDDEMDLIQIRLREHQQHISGGSSNGGGSNGGSGGDRSPPSNNQPSPMNVLVNGKMNGSPSPTSSGDCGVNDNGNGGALLIPSSNRSASPSVPSPPPRHNRPSPRSIEISSTNNNKEIKADNNNVIPLSSPSPTTRYPSPPLRSDRPRPLPPQQTPPLQHQQPSVTAAAPQPPATRPLPLTSHPNNIQYTSPADVHNDCPLIALPTNRPPPLGANNKASTDRDDVSTRTTALKAPQHDIVHGSANDIRRHFPCDRPLPLLPHLLSAANPRYIRPPQKATSDTLLTTGVRSSPDASRFDRAPTSTISPSEPAFEDDAVSPTPMSDVSPSDATVNGSAHNDRLNTAICTTPTIVKLRKRDQRRGKHVGASNIIAPPSPAVPSTLSVSPQVPSSRPSPVVVPSSAQQTIAELIVTPARRESSTSSAPDAPPTADARTGAIIYDAANKDKGRGGTQYPLGDPTQQPSNNPTTAVSPQYPPDVPVRVMSGNITIPHPPPPQPIARSVFIRQQRIADGQLFKQADYPPMPTVARGVQGSAGYGWVRRPTTAVVGSRGGGAAAADHPLTRGGTTPSASVYASTTTNTLTTCSASTGATSAQTTSTLRGFNGAATIADCFVDIPPPVTLPSLLSLRSLDAPQIPACWTHQPALMNKNIRNNNSNKSQQPHTTANTTTAVMQSIYRRTFREATLENKIIENAQLKRCVLNHCYLKNCVITECEIDGAVCAINGGGGGNDAPSSSANHKRPSCSAVVTCRIIATSITSVPVVVSCVLDRCTIIDGSAVLNCHIRQGFVGFSERERSRDSPSSPNYECCASLPSVFGGINSNDFVIVDSFLKQVHIDGYRPSSNNNGHDQRKTSNMNDNTDGGANSAASTSSSLRLTRCYLVQCEYDATIEHIDSTFSECEKFAVFLTAENLIALEGDAAVASSHSHLDTLIAIHQQQQHPSANAHRHNSMMSHADRSRQLSLAHISSNNVSRAAAPTSHTCNGGGRFVLHEMTQLNESLLRQNQHRLRSRKRTAADAWLSK